MASTNGIIQLRDWRLSFPNIWNAQQVQGQGKPAFSGSFLAAPDHPQIDEINEIIDAVALEKWGAKAKAIMAQLRGQDKVCLHNGDLKAQYEGYEGNYYISARAYSKPLIIGRLREPLTESDGKPYGGCFVNASIQVWAQDNQFGKRVNATMRGVQFLRDGDAFAGGAPATDEEFEDLGVDESGLA